MIRSHQLDGATAAHPAASVEVSVADALSSSVHGSLEPRAAITLTLIVYSIGHSRHSAEQFVALLHARGLALLADVRSHPASRWAPHFAKAALEQLLGAQGIGYEFLGRELGGRPQGAQYYGADGALDCTRRAEAAEFQSGILRLLALAQTRPTVMLCAEEDPTHCHRRRLVTPALSRAGVSVVHLRGDGRVEPEASSGPASPQLGLFR